MQPYDKADVKYDWWAGNAQFANTSGLVTRVEIF